MGTLKKTPSVSGAAAITASRSSDGRGEYEWEPESDGRYLVHLYGRGPWKVEVRQSAIEPYDFEVAAAPGPDDEVLFRKIELRAR